MLIEMPQSWLFSPPPLSLLRVWFAIQAESKTGEEAPSIETLARLLTIPRRAVCVALKGLADSGAPIVYEAGTGKHTSKFSILGGVCKKPHTSEKEETPTIPNTSFGGVQETVHPQRSEPQDLPLYTRAHHDAPAELIKNNSTVRVNNLTIKSHTTRTILKEGVQGEEDPTAEKRRRCDYKGVLLIFDEEIRSVYPWLPLAEPWETPKTLGGTSAKTVAGSKLGASIKRAWSQNPDQQWFRHWFRQVLAECLTISDFHRGESKNPWCASLLWILGKKARDKINSGEYEKRRNADAEKASGAQQRNNTAKEITASMWGLRDKAEEKIIDVQTISAGGLQWRA